MSQSPLLENGANQVSEEPLKKKIPTLAQRRRYLNSIDEFESIEEIELSMRKSFQEAQTTVSVHKRHAAILKRNQQRAKDLELTEEFNEIFCKLMDKVLPIKKNIAVADRIVKFISTYFVFIIPSNLADGDEGEDDMDIDEEEDQFYSEFIDHIIRHLIKGMTSFNKVVRYRVCHLLSHLIGDCGVLERDLYDLLNEELLARIYDKEPSVRLKAIQTLACFQNSDGEDISDAGKKIRFIMQNDLNAEVRRACIKQIEKNKYTEPYIVERARDENDINRRLVFSKALPGFTHFTNIDSSNRNKLLSWGLRDRDETVRKAATKWLTEIWMKDLDGEILEFVERLRVLESDVADTAVRTLFDARPDIVAKFTLSSESLNSLTPEFALLVRVYFEYCQDNDKQISIDTNFPEAAPFAGIIQKYFKDRRENLLTIESHTEELSENPDLALELGIIDPDEYEFIILQLLKIAVDFDYSDEFGRSKMHSILRSTLANDTLNETLVQVLMECLRKLSINERDFCQMIVEIINDLKDSAYDEVTTKIQSSEKSNADGLDDNKNDLASRVDKLINENDDDEDDDEASNDEEDNDDSDKNEDDEDDKENEGDDDEDDADGSMYHSAMADISRQSIKEANKSRQHELDQVSQLPPATLVECLIIAKCMLQLVYSPLKENISLLSILDNLIIPCVNHRTEVDIRDLSLMCYGLCGLLDKELAVQTMVVAGIFVTRSDIESFIVTGLKVMCDLLAVHGISILQTDAERSIDSMAVAKVFYRTLKDDTKLEAQATVAEALFKLFLCGVITDDELFETTLLTYFNPKISKNEALKQCLTFCIPTYAYSHASHQETIVRVSADTITRLFNDWSTIEEANEETETPITPQMIIESFSEWTDPYLTAILNIEEVKVSSLHVDFAFQLLKVLRDYNPNDKTVKNLYKPIFRVLPKLTFTSKVGLTKLLDLKEELENPELCQGELDTALQNDLFCRNSFLKFSEYVEQCYEEAKDAEDKREINDKNNNKANSEINREDKEKYTNNIEDEENEAVEDAGNIEDNNENTASNEPEDKNGSIIKHDQEAFEEKEGQKEEEEEKQKEQESDQSDSITNDDVIENNAGSDPEAEDSTNELLTMGDINLNKESENYESDDSFELTETNSFDYNMIKVKHETVKKKGESKVTKPVHKAKKATKKSNKKTTAVKSHMESRSEDECIGDSSAIILLDDPNEEDAVMTPPKKPKKKKTNQKRKTRSKSRTSKDVEVFVVSD